MKWRTRGNQDGKPQRPQDKRGKSEPRWDSSYRERTRSASQDLGHYFGGYGAFRGAGQRAYGSGAEQAGTDYAHGGYGHQSKGRWGQSRRSFGSDGDRSRYGGGGHKRDQGMSGTHASANWNRQRQLGRGDLGYEMGPAQGERFQAPETWQQSGAAQQDDYRNFSHSEQSSPWRESGKKHPGPSFYGVGPRGYKRSDAKILEEVCDLLAFDREIDASQITVQVKNAVVKLEGEVDNRRVKYLVEDIAENVMGVEEVDNRLKLHRHLLSKPEWADSESAIRARGERPSGEEES